MKRRRTLVERPELAPVLKALGLHRFPARPPPARLQDRVPRTYGGRHQRWSPNPAAGRVGPAAPRARPEWTEVESQQVPREWDDDLNQVPPGWDA